MEALFARHLEDAACDDHGSAKPLSGSARRHGPRLTARLSQDPDFPHRIPAVGVLLHEGDVEVSVDVVDIFAEIIEEELLLGDDSRIEGVAADDDDVSLLRKALVVMGVLFRPIIRFLKVGIPSSGADCWRHGLISVTISLYSRF